MTPTCTVCNKPLGKANTTGLCGSHAAQKAFQEGRRVRQRPMQVRQ